jgi:hypothetical protein
MDGTPRRFRPESLPDQFIYLGDGERLRLRNIPGLALRWLSLITEMGGLPETDRLRRSRTGSQFGRVSGNDKIDSSVRDARIAVLDSGQQLLLREGNRRSASGSRTIEVLEGPERVDEALVAMLTVLEGRSISAERAPGVFDKSEGISHEEYDDRVGSVLYAESLLRDFRPDFGQLPEEEQLALIVGTSA